MRNAMKIRLAVFLSIMMVLPTIFSVLPMTATEVSAASKGTMSWYWSGAKKANKPIQVEKGQKFYIGDYVTIGDSKASGYTTVASMVKATYSSSKKSIATVKSNGYLTAKKVGTTTITVKYKGKKITAKLKVVPIGTFKKITKRIKGFTGLKKQAKKLAKKIPDKVTAENESSLLEAKESYKDYYYEEIGTYKMVIDEAGTLDKWESAPFKASDGKTYYQWNLVSRDKLAVPQAGRYLYLNAMLEEYAYKNGK